MLMYEDIFYFIVLAPLLVITNSDNTLIILIKIASHQTQAGRTSEETF
jgi:hypothetical protein